MAKTIALMQALIRISGIRDRADALGLKLTDLCGRAGVSASTVYKWLSGTAEPRLMGYDAACGKLEDVLRGEELRQRDRLIALHGETKACS